MARNYTHYEMQDGKSHLAATYFNPIWRDIDNRLGSLEGFSPEWEAEIARLNERGLARIDTLLVPAFESIQDLAGLGFLTANIVGEVNFVTGPQDVLIEDTQARLYFSPSSFVIVESSANYSDYLIARVVEYDKETGQLALNVLTVSDSTGDGGYSDCIASVSAGSTLAALNAATEAAQGVERVLTVAALQIGGVQIANSASAISAAGEASFTVDNLPGGNEIPTQGLRFVGEFSGTNTGNVSIVVNTLNSGNALSVFVEGNHPLASYIQPGENYLFTFIGTKWHMQPVSETGPVDWAKKGNFDVIPENKLPPPPNSPSYWAEEGFVGIIPTNRLPEPTPFGIPVASGYVLKSSHQPHVGVIEVTIPDLPPYDTERPTNGTRFIVKFTADISPYTSLQAEINDQPGNVSRLAVTLGSQEYGAVMPADYIQADHSYIFTVIHDGYNVAGVETQDLAIQPLEDSRQAEWAEVGNTDTIPVEKIPSLSSDGSTVSDWAKANNNSLIPVAKLPEEALQSGGTDGVSDWALTDDASVIPDAKLPTIPTAPAAWAETGQPEPQGGGIINAGTVTLNASNRLVLNDGLFGEGQSPVTGSQFIFKLTATNTEAGPTIRHGATLTNTAIPGGTIVPAQYLLADRWYVATYTTEFWELQELSRVRTEPWAQHGNDTAIPASKLIHAPDADYAAWAGADNEDLIPESKLPTLSEAPAEWAESGERQPVEIGVGDTYFPTATGSMLFVDEITGRLYTTKQVTTHATPATGSFANHTSGSIPLLVEYTGFEITPHMPTYRPQAHPGHFLVNRWDATIFKSVAEGGSYVWSAVEWPASLIELGLAEATDTVVWLGSFVDEDTAVQAVPNHANLTTHKYFAFIDTRHRIYSLTTHTAGVASVTTRNKVEQATHAEVSALAEVSDDVRMYDSNEITPSESTEGILYISPTEGRVYVTQRSLSHATAATGSFTTLEAGLDINLLGYTDESVEANTSDIPDPEYDDNRGTYLIERYTAAVYHSIRVGAPEDNHWVWSQVGWADALVGMLQATSADNVYWGEIHPNAYFCLQHFPAVLDPNKVYFAYAQDIHRVIKITADTYSAGINAHKRWSLEALARVSDVGEVASDLAASDISLGDTQRTLTDTQVRLSENVTIAETALNSSFMSHFRIDMMTNAPGATLDNTTRFVSYGRYGDRGFSGLGFVGDSVPSYASLLGSSTQNGLTNYGGKELQAGTTTSPTLANPYSEYGAANRQLVGAIVDATTPKEIYELVVATDTTDSDDRVRMVVYTGFGANHYNNIGSEQTYANTTLAAESPWQPLTNSANTFLQLTAPYQASGYVFVGLEFDKSTATGNPEASDSTLLVSSNVSQAGDNISTRVILNSGQNSFFTSSSQYLLMQVYSARPANAGNLTSIDFEIAEVVSDKSKLQLHLYVYYDPDFPPRFSLVNPWQAFLNLKDGDGGEQVGDSIPLLLTDSANISSTGTVPGDSDREYYRLIFEGDLPDDNTSSWAAWQFVTPIAGVADAPVTGLTVLQAFTVTV